MTTYFVEDEHGNGYYVEASSPKGAAAKFPAFAPDEIVIPYGYGKVEYKFRTFRADKTGDILTVTEEDDETRPGDQHPEQ